MLPATLQLEEILSDQEKIRAFLEQNHYQNPLQEKAPGKEITIRKELATWLDAEKTPSKPSFLLLLVIDLRKAKTL